MPIKGLSEIIRSPRLGKFHLGEKALSAKGSQYPKAVDYFVANSESIPDPALLAKIRAAYGERPKSLTVLFNSTDRELIFPQYYKLYSQSEGLKCKGDGVRATYTEGGELKERECTGPENCQHCPRDKQTRKPHCKALAHLQFFLMFPPANGKGWEMSPGIFQIDTSSFYSIVNINSFFELAGDRLRGVPIELRLIPQQVAPDGKKKIVWVLQPYAPLLTMPEIPGLPAISAPGVAGAEIAADFEVPENEPESVNHAEIPSHHVPAPESAPKYSNIYGQINQLFKELRVPVNVKNEMMKTMKPDEILAQLKNDLAHRNEQENLSL